jgi:hypothetical protein
MERRENWCAFSQEGGHYATKKACVAKSTWTKERGKGAEVGSGSRSHWRWDCSVQMRIAKNGDDQDKARAWRELFGARYLGARRWKIASEFRLEVGALPTVDRADQGALPRLFPASLLTLFPISSYSTVLRRIYPAHILLHCLNVTLMTSSSAISPISKPPLSVPPYVIQYQFAHRAMHGTHATSLPTTTISFSGSSIT